MKIDAEFIIRNLSKIHQYNEQESVTFETDQTTGAIPVRHLETYIDTGLFE